MTYRTPMSRSKHPLRGPATVVVASLLIHSACGDGTGPASDEPPVVAIGQTVSGTVDAPTRTAAFAFDGVEGQTLRVFFQTTSGAATDSLMLQVLSPSDAVLTRVTSPGNQAVLEARAGSVFTIAATARYRVEVRGVDTGTDQGPFSFRIVAIDLKPEAVAEVVTIGSVTTGESIGTPGDVDEFRFDANGGDSVVAFLQPLGVSPADSLALSIRPVQNIPFQPGLIAPGVVDSLRAYTTGRFVIPSSGTYLVRVTGRNSRATLAYRLELARVTSAPESAAQLIPIGTVVEEAIDFRGDRDEFYLDVAPGEQLTFRFRRLTRTPDGSIYYQVELVDPGGYRVFQQLQEANETVVTPPPLAGGRYRYRILPAFGASEPDPGRYRFLVERAAPSP